MRGPAPEECSHEWCPISERATNLNIKPNPPAPDVGLTNLPTELPTLNPTTVPHSSPPFGLSGTTNTACHQTVHPINLATIPNLKRRHNQTLPRNQENGCKRGNRVGILRQAFTIVLLSAAIALAQSSAPPAGPPAPAQSQPAPSPTGPVLQQRPAPTPGSPQGRIQLDVVVTGKQGAPASGLDLQDFTLLDNKKAENILSFQAVDVTSQKTEPTAPPAQVILLLDLVNATFAQASVIESQMVKFFQQNGGRLAYPTSIAIASDQGLRFQPTPSTDGNHLAAQLNATLRTIGPAGARLDEVARFQSSLKTLLAIADNQSKTPNRKILIWTGPGWPILVGSNYLPSSQDRKRYFDAIVEISTRLREAHIALYNISPMNPDKAGALTLAPPQPILTPNAEAPLQTRARPILNAPTDGSSYKEFVRGVKSVHQADSGDLSLQVIAIQSGGRVLDPSNDLASQIVQCVQDLGPFYRISFDPPQAEHPDDYHDLKIQIAKPGLTARTNTGVYIQP